MLNKEKINLIKFKKFNEGDSISIYEMNYINNKYCKSKIKNTGFIIYSSFVNLAICSYTLNCNYATCSVMDVFNFSKTLLIEKMVKYKPRNNN